MKISMNWLADYVALDDIGPDELAERLTLATAEVESVDVVTNSADRVVVARVEQVEPVPGGDAPAVLVTVDTGAGRVTTVTRASNVRAGMKTVYAPPGAQLPAGAIGVESVYGYSSVGLLCSAADVGIGTQDEVLLECPADVGVGRVLSTYIPTKDALIDIDNKSLTHRPDLWGHYGFAREVAVILRRELRPLALADLDRAEELPAFPVRVDTPRDCARFGCLAVDIATNAPSPLHIQGRLYLLGLRSTDAVVDSTNYVALELGQPTHIYDREGISDIRVAAMGEPGEFTTLDGHVRQIDPGDLMVWSGSRPIGIAGIMGGLDSAVKPATRHVLLESGNFHPARVRRTAARLKLSTDASQRFEKNQPPANVRPGLARLVQLLDDAGTRPLLASRATVIDAGIKDQSSVMMPADYIRRLAGADISDQRVTQILGDLGFEPEIKDGSLTVSVPPFRSRQDISLPADIAEEVLRVYGYGNITPELLRAELTSAPINQGLRHEHKARRVLAQAHAYAEVESYPWFDDSWLAAIGYQPEKTLRLRNPIAPDKARLRTTLMPNALKMVRDNVQHAEAFRLFEIGRVFVPGAVGRSADPDGHAEQVRLVGVSVILAKTGTLEDHYRRTRSAVENLGVMVSGTAFQTGVPRTVAGQPWQVPDLWTELHTDDRNVGTIGVLMGPIRDLVAPQRHVAWFEIQLDALDGALYPARTYRHQPPVPGSEQDFSLLWRRSDGYQELEKLLDEFHDPLVQCRKFVTVYHGNGLPEGLASYTFRYWLQHSHRTLTAEELETFRHAFNSFLAKYDISLR